MFKEVTLNNLQKQFGYTNGSNLLLQRASVWDKYMGNISQTFVDEIMNLDTCVSDALDYFWGRIFKINRTFEDGDGNLFTLSDDQFREVLKIRAFGTVWQGDILSMNEFLGNLFKDRGICYMRDNLDMTVQWYVFYFSLEDWERYLFTTQDILPRCAGIGTGVYELSEDFLGFYGTEYQPFDQAPFFTTSNSNN